jgi:hypothetical protein
MEGPAPKRRPFRLQRWKHSTPRLDPAKFRLENRGMKRAPSRGAGRPGAYALSAGRGLRRCADGHGHPSGELQMTTPNGRRGLLEAYSQLVTHRRHSMNIIHASCHDRGISGRDGLFVFERGRPSRGRLAAPPTPSLQARMHTGRPIVPLSSHRIKLRTQVRSSMKSTNVRPRGG